MNRIEIPLSKSKILLLLFGAFGFVVFGVLFIVNPDKYISPIMPSPDFIRIVGFASVLFFGAALFYGMKKMFDNTVGLVIDETGITDNSNASSTGLIKWVDITEIRTEQVASTKFLLIYTNNPEEYLDKAKGFKRKLMQGNNKMYETPLSITSNSLKCDFNELENLLSDRLNQHRKGMPNS
jgi:hypothetical protein